MLSLFQRAVDVSHEALVQSRTIASMRRQMAVDANVGKIVMENYYAQFCRTFPFKSEREELAVYLDYLTDSDFDWDCQIMFENGQVIGGIQFQRLSVLDSCVLFAEHFWLRGKDWFHWDGFRSQDRFQMLGRQLEKVAREAGAVAIVWECNDLHQMTQWQKRLDRKAGLPPEKRIKLWGRYGTVLDVAYAQPRLTPDSEPVEFLMLCTRLLAKNFQFTGRFYRELFKNFVLTFNDDPESDECYQRIVEASMVYEDDEVIPRIKFGQRRTILKKNVSA